MEKVKSKTSKMKAGKPNNDIPPAEKISAALTLFDLTLDKCLHLKKLYVGEFSVAKCRRHLPDREMIEHFYRYEATFKHGPFNELTLTLRKEYFRPFDEEELTNMIFNTLSSCSSFRFNFEIQKYEKKRVLVG